MKRMLRKVVSLILVSILCLTQAVLPGSLSLADEEETEVFVVLTDSENIAATTEVNGLGRSNVTQSSQYAHGGTYSMQYNVPDGENGSMWNDRKNAVDLSTFAATREELAISLWVYTEDASTEAEFTFKLTDDSGNRISFKGLKKTAMAPTAGEWHQVVIPLKNGEFSENFNWKYFRQWALESAKGSAFTLWVDDIALVSYPASPYTSLYTLAKCDALTEVSKSKITLETTIVHDGTGSYKLSPGEGSSSSMWYTGSNVVDCSTLAPTMDDIALSFWVYAESVPEDENIKFAINLCSTASFDGPKLTYDIAKKDIAPTAGEWHQVVLPFAQLTNKNNFDWTNLTWWRIYQTASGPDYTMYIDQIELVSLAPKITGMNFSAGDMKIDLTKAFDSSIATMEAFVLVDSMTPDDQVVGVIVGNTDAETTPGDGTVRLSVDTGGNPLLLWNGGEATVRFDADVRTGQFLHLAVVRDAAAGEFRLYIDGKLADTQKATSTDAVSDVPYVIGGDHRPFKETNSTFDGWIGNVRVWSTVRSAQEIADNVLYTELTGTETDLLGNWLLKEDAKLDDTAVDVSANQNHGVINRKTDWIAPDDTKGDFTLVALPDTQIIVQARTEIYRSLFEWIAANQESENIQYVLSLGDIVNNGNASNQWETAKKGFELIDGKVPYTLIPGNHDYIDWNSYRPMDNYNNTFFTTDYADMDTLQGVYEEGHMENTYHCFSVQGINYMILALEFMPRDAVLEWACDVVETHPDYNVIVTTHGYLNGKGEREKTDSVSKEYATLLGDDFNAGEDVWNKLVSRYSNIFMVLCGHVESDNYDVKHLESIGENGNTVHQIMANAQWLDDDLWGTSMKGAGLLLLMRFTDYGKTINLDFYSPYHDLSYREENCFSITIPHGQLQYVGVTGVEDGATYDLGNGAPTVRFDTGTVTLGGQELSSGYKFTQAGSYTLNIDMYGETSTITFTVTGTLDTEAPVIAGVGDGGVYYTTQTITVTDAELDSITVNGEAVADVTAAITLYGNPAQTTEYTITATDKAGNSTTVAVTMKPISDISSPIAGITTENVKTTDAQAIQSVVTQLDELLQTESLTDADKTALEDAKADANALLAKVAETEAAVVGLTDAVDAYDVETVKLTDKETIAFLLAEIDDLLAGQNITDEQKTALEAAKAAAEALLKKIDEILAIPEYTLGDINGDNNIDASDALMALQHSVKLNILEGDDFDAANVDGNQVVDATDALYILQYSVKLINKFPAEK